MLHLLVVFVQPNKLIYGSSVHSSKPVVSACNVLSIKCNSGGNICSLKLASSS